MSREHVLEAVLRSQAAEVELDPGALAAILNAPRPSSTKEQQRSNHQSPATSATPQPQASSGASAVGAGGSLLGKLAGLLGATVLVGAVAVGAGSVYLSSNPQCPALDSALRAVNDEVFTNVGENPNIGLSCDGSVTSLSDIRSSLAPENRALFDEHLDDIEAAHACLTDAATPLGITSVLDLLSSECTDS